MFEGMKKILPQTIKNYFHLVAAFFAALFFRFPARKLIVIGVTGTDGKTTTTSMVYHSLKKLGLKVGMVSTVEAKIGEKEVKTGFHVTTPDSFQVQKFLREMVKAGTKYAVVEMTSHGLDQNRVAFIPLRVAVITNITPEHLDYHKNLNKYTLAKAKILRGTRFRVLNFDDPSFSQLRLMGFGQLISFGLRQGADIRASSVAETEFGLELKINLRGKQKDKESFPLTTPLAGRFNVYNILATVGVLKALGFEGAKTGPLLEDFPGVKGRMQFISEGQDFFVVVDFAHTPAALEAALKSLQHYQHNKLICVFGAASERDILKRGVMGKVATKLADYSIFTSEDPRNEDPNKIIEEIAAGAVEVGGVFNQSFWKIADRAEAIGLATKNLAKKGDIVAIFGKGHEETMNIGGKEIPWSDEKLARQSLKERFFK
ncbi:MAG: UDP-N-acetylmuramoyl-L-alanyl-D-glutamate--2,6-diaminopimelate ligase [bacterium]|nr:UDP-N-acetylmuramoyl-L-alanyl-D-glutamate--2,6-diaminopimelate ligase [bacterium]